MNEDAREALLYILETELNDFCDSFFHGDSMGLTEEEIESFDELDTESKEFTDLINKACSSGSTHVYARAYRGLFQGKAK